MNVLVTGGSGFIGTPLVGALLEAGHQVRIFDHEPSPKFESLVQRDHLLNYDGLAVASVGVDAVFHLAAEHRDDVRPKSRYYDVNVEGTQNVVRAAEAAGVKRIVFTSTVAVYGLDQGVAAESTPTNPFNDYGRSKLEAEAVLIRWAEAAPDRSLVIVRPTVVFGEGNRGNVYTLIHQIASRKFVMIGDGSNHKSVCYVGNLVPFLVQLLDAKAGVHITNYVDKPDLTMQEFVKMVRAELGARKRLVRIPYWAGMAGGYAFDTLSRVTGRRFPISSIRIKKFCANTQVAMEKRDSAFVPPFTVQQGLQRMIRSLNENGRQATAPVESP
jgi:nucleoside-diphosphate-sugar epimerase